ncbi:MAG TPA: hypothetical protein VK866_02060, partial [Acidimicrobiales bacterium]|nr:hypothetical protein [Acidimicrobiales bacterium]
MTEAEPTRAAAGRSVRTRLVPVVGAVLGLGAAAFVVRELVDQWDEARAAIENASLGWLAVAAVAAT